MSKYPYTPDYAVAPGGTLQETLDELGLTQRDLAARTGLHPKTVNEIIKGTAPITAETALLLERVTGVPASFWNTAEATYRERLARAHAQERVADQVRHLDRFAYSAMVRLKLVPPAREKHERVQHLLQFFGVASFAEWDLVYTQLAGAARDSATTPSELGGLSAWLRAGELLAQRRTCADFDSDRFMAALTNIRSLAAQPVAEVWEQVKDLCANAGVAVVLVPLLPKAHVFGFTRWLTPRKALIQLSLRYKTDDLLWFTFFHEAAHILLHGKRDVFLEVRGAQSPKEQEANQWAADLLITPSSWQAFIADRGNYGSESQIRRFAGHLKLAPGIVVGRLQFEKRVPPSHFNAAKQRLDIKWLGLQ